MRDMSMLETLRLILFGVVGFFGALSIGLMIGGYTTYIARAGLEGRVAGIRVMEWGVSVMFVVMLVAVGMKFLS
jgi:hypothetical protein